MLTQRYSAGVWLAIYVALQLAAHFITLPPRLPGLVVLPAALLTTVIFMLVWLSTCAAVTNVVRRPGLAAALLVVGILGWLLVQVLGPERYLQVFLWRVDLPNPPNLATTVAGRLGLGILQELFLLLGTFGLGILVVSIIREPNILLPVAIFAAVADCFIVYHPMGPVYRLLKTQAGQHFIHSVSAKVPVVHGFPIPMPSIGPADFVFLAFFFGCAFRFDLDVKRTFVALFVFLTLAYDLALLGGWSVPALVPMGLGFLVANWRRFTLSREELQAVGAAAAIVLILVLGLVFFGKT